MAAEQRAAWRASLRWALTLPLFWVIAALPLVLLAGVGRGVGLPSLVYAAAWPTRLALGLALGVHACELWFVAYLLRSDRGAGPADRTATRRFARWVLAPWGLVVLAAMARAVATGRGSLVAAGSILAAAIVTALLGTRALVWAASLAARPGPLDRFLALRIAAPLGVELRALDRLQLRVSLAVVLVWAALSVGENLAHRTAGAFAALVLAVLLLGSYGAVRYWAREYRMLVYLAILASTAVCNLVGFDRGAEVPGLAEPDGARPRLAGTGPEHAPGLLDEVQVLARWKDDRVRPKLVVVATSGGGIRAAAWTAHVLGTLERDAALPGIAHDIRMITGASGGMVGAATWVATLLPRDEARACGRDSACLHRAHDVLAEVATGSIDAVAVHFALAVLRDRGSSLEAQWVENTAGALGRTFDALVDDERAGAVPSLVFSPLVVDDGRRVLISNLGLHALTAAIDPWPQGPRELSPTTPRAAVELFDLFPVHPGFTLATAARVSASFPYVSPFPWLPTAEPAPRLADAGLFDPYGVELATRWIASHAAWLMANTGGVVLIEIRDDATVRSDVALARPVAALRAGHPLFGPLEALLSARQAGSAQRNDVAVDALAHRFAAAGQPAEFFTRIVLARSGEASLSWHLSSEEREAIEASLPAGTSCAADELATLDASAEAAPADARPTCSPNLAELDRLRRWWR